MRCVAPSSYAKFDFSVRVCVRVCLYVCVCNSMFVICLCAREYVFLVICLLRVLNLC